MANSAAELTAGVICMCLPTIPVLFSRRRSSRRARNVGGSPRSHHLPGFTRKKPTNLSDQDPFDEESFQLGVRYGQVGDIEAPPPAVVTNIEGGNSAPTRDLAPVDVETLEKEVVQKPAIMRTIVIEQSQVLRYS